MPKLFLVRHGQSEWNEKDLFTGWMDCGLSKLGEKEAENCGNLLKNTGDRIDILYTSRLLRAIKTANIVLEKVGSLHIDVKRSWRLNERHYGELQGKNKAEVKQKYGEKNFTLWRRSYDVPPPPILQEMHKTFSNDPRYLDVEPGSMPFSESLSLVKQRLIPYWQDHIRNDLIMGKNVLVVAHGNSLRALIMHLDDVLELEIAKINIPTAIPLLYEFDNKLNLKCPSRYLDPEAAERGISSVANQGKT